MWASQWEIDALRVEIGDLLVCEGGEVGRGAIVEIEPPEDCIIQNALHRVRGKAEGDVRFLRYILIHAASQGWFDVLCNRATIAHFTVDKFREMWLWAPSLDQQKTIADFLDNETLRIDILINEKELLLTLLAEKRLAIISHAVAGGLISKTPRQGSGLPWLGEIPEHWRIERAKYLFKQSSLPVNEEDEIVTCFRDGQVTLRKNRREEGFTNAILELGYQGIRAGQLVLHSMDAFAGAIGVSDSDGKCSPEYIVCDPVSEEIVNDYYGYLLRTMALSGFIQASCPAVRERAPRIRFNDFGEMFFPVPPLDEQRAIVEHIETEAKKLDDLRAETEHTIGLLKERRAALIAAAVTGQLNVGVQA
jgi:type I restriction enzyme, S subunit